MNTSLKTILLLAFTFMLSVPAAFSSVSEILNADKGAHYSLTNLKLSPKQFNKAYKAEKREYRQVKTNTFNRMIKKRHGSRFYRWIQRNF